MSACTPLRASVWSAVKLGTSTISSLDAGADGKMSRSFWALRAVLRFAARRE